MDIAVRFSTSHVPVYLYDVMKSRFHIIRHLFGISKKLIQLNDFLRFFKIVPHVHSIGAYTCLSNRDGGTFLYQAVFNITEEIYLTFKLCSSKTLNWFNCFKSNTKLCMSYWLNRILDLTQQWRTRLSPPLGVSTVKLHCQTSHDGHTPFLPETIFTNFIPLTISNFFMKNIKYQMDGIFSNKVN